MEIENLKEEVLKAVEDAAGETSTPESSVSLDNVKPAEETPVIDSKIEEKTEVPETKKVERGDEDLLSKKQKQIDNLNIALSQEREKSKVDASKVEALEKKLEELQGNLKRVFAPEPEIVEEEQPKIPVTVDDLEAWYEAKRQKEEQDNNFVKTQESLKQEISQLEKEYDGTDGKPKYDDSEVYEWQKTNNKLYLTPREAFITMKENDIIDWRVKQTLAGKKQTTDVEKPGAGSEVHIPSENELKTDADIKKAVYEAIGNLDSEI